MCIRDSLNALALLPGVPINTWSVVLNGAEAYRYQTGTVAFPRVLPQLRAAALVQWVLERLPRTQVLLCSESRLFFLSPRDLADPDFLLSHQPCTFTNLGAALDYPWLKILFAAPRPDLEHLELDFDHYQAAVEERQEELADTQTEAMASIIAEQTEAYILDKAGELGLEVTVRVETRTEGNGIPVPWSAELTGSWSQALASALETELGIPAERQVWHEREAEN